MNAFRDQAGVRLQLYGQAGLPIIGPYLWMPLAMRLSGARVVHGPANALPLLPNSLPGVVTIHDVTIYEHPEWFPDGQWLSTRVLVPLSARRARLVICPSNATARAAVRLLGVSGDRCRVIPHGVEQQFAIPVSTPERHRLRVTLGLPERYLLQVGTIQPRKNYLTTLRALAAMPPRERIPLMVAGDFGWKFEPVLQAVQELDLAPWVRFVGFVGMRDLPALYQMAEVVTFPSYDEGFGLPVLEAFAAGVPVLAAAAGSIPEVAGEAAMLGAPDDHRWLADGLARILRDDALRAQLVAAGRERAARFTWAASARAHRAVYLEAVG